MLYSHCVSISALTSLIWTLMPGTVTKNGLGKAAIGVIPGKNTEAHISTSKSRLPLKWVFQTGCWRYANIASLYLFEPLCSTLSVMKNKGRAHLQVEADLSVCHQSHQDKRNCVVRGRFTLLNYSESSRCVGWLNLLCATKPIAKTVSDKTRPAF